MNALMKRIGSGLLALLLVLSLVCGSLPSVSYAASKNDSTTRHNYNVGLSSQALSYYTGNYTWAKMSTLQGGGASCLDMDSDLFETLHNLMTSTMTKSVSYDSLTSHWPTTDDNMLFYSDFESTGYNREHVWPKSHASFKEKNGGADLHHLRPTNSTINSTRSSYTFGNVKEKVSGYRTKENGGKTVLWYEPNYTVSGCEGLVEVRDNIKGDVARILLYVYVRWEEPNLFEKDTTPTVGPSDNANDGIKVIEDLETLLEWCEIDPVDQWEMTRNDLTQNVQGNRNVFIDYPEFAWLLFSEDVPAGYNTPSDNGGTAVNPGTPSCTHQWRSASCTLPKTCTKCGATDGVALGHKWQNATCQQAKKCTVCGTTEGSIGNHADANSDNACDVCGTSIGTTQPPQDGNVYVKLTQLPTDWSGKYLIVCETKKTAFNGALSSLDASNNYVPVTISNNQIVLDAKYAEAYVTISPYNNGYTIKTSSGFYVGQTSNANGLQTSTTQKYENTLSFSSSNLTAKSGGAYLRFNDDSGQMRFRYYKSGTYSLQEAVSLYKLQETHTHTYTKAVTAPTCTAEGYTTYTCSCGDSYKADQVAATGHTASAAVTEKIVSATCTADGSYDTVVYCFVCTAQISRTTTTVDALGHSYDKGVVTTEPTYEAPGVKTYTCSCGATYTEEIPQLEKPAVELFKIDRTNVRMGSDLSLLFAFKVSALSDLDGVYAEFTKAVAGGKPKVTTVSSSDEVLWATTTIAGEKYYVVEYVGLAAKEMADEITMVVKDAEGNALSEAFTSSMKVYAMEKLVTSSNKEFKVALVDMLNYGAAAQVYFKYDANNAANKDLTEAQKALASAAGTYEVALEADDAYYNATNLRFESKINLLLRLKISRDTYAVFTWKDHYGKPHEKRVEGQDYETSSGMFVIELDELVVADARAKVTCTIYNNADDSVVTTVVESVESEVAGTSDTSTAKALYVAFMKFADSAYAYMH